MKPVRESAPAGRRLSHGRTHILRWKWSKCAGGGRWGAVVDFVLRQHAGWMMKTFFAASVVLTISCAELDRRSALRQFMAATHDSHKPALIVWLTVETVEIQWRAVYRRLLRGHWLFKDRGKFCCAAFKCRQEFCPFDSWSLFFFILAKPN